MTTLSVFWSWTLVAGRDIRNLSNIPQRTQKLIISLTNQLRIRKLVYLEINKLI
jgi:hypothetical protein